VDVEMIAVRYAEGERGVIQLNLRDVGPRKRVEEKLRRADEEFRQAQKMEAVGRLAGGVAHDFNNLLTAVMGYGELLGQSLQEGHPGRRLVEQIRKAAERAAVLTRRLLAVGRRQMLQRAVLSVAEVVVEIQQLLVVMMRENIELDIVSPPDVGAVMADRGQLEQVVLNLTLNARDAMPDGGRITIEIANMDVEPDFLEGSPNVPPGRYVALTVRDTGIGMSAETQAHLFEPFFTTKPAGTGVGLGLSTVYGIVTQSGGHIRVTSELGAGSAFKVYLPRADAEPEAKEPARNIAVPSGTETILLVEDEPLVRAVARAFLEGLGYQVVEAASGADALRLSREFQGRIDLLLTDVVMPQMSGRDLALQLARERPEMRALYTSGHTENVISHHGVLNEGISFLEKPFTQESLAAKVRAILDGK
jgi:two-component system cell cycle sensor histidine kinase/response regulator CckA